MSPLSPQLLLERCSNLETAMTERGWSNPVAYMRVGNFCHSPFSLWVQAQVDPDDDKTQRFAHFKANSAYSIEDMFIDAEEWISSALFDIEDAQKQAFSAEFDRLQKQAEKLGIALSQQPAVSTAAE